MLSIFKFENEFNPLLSFCPGLDPEKSAWDSKKLPRAGRPLQGPRRPFPRPGGPGGRLAGRRRKAPENLGFPCGPRGNAPTAEASGASLARVSPGGAPGRGPPVPGARPAGARGGPSDQVAELPPPSPVTARSPRRDPGPRRGGHAGPGARVGTCVCAGSALAWSPPGLPTGLRS